MIYKFSTSRCHGLVKASVTGPYGLYRVALGEDEAQAYEILATDVPLEVKAIIQERLDFLRTL